MQPKKAFESWLELYKRYSTTCPDSICDWDKGLNIWYARDKANKLSLDRDDPSALIETDDADVFDKTVAKILRAVHVPTYELATRKELLEGADRLETLIDEAKGGGSRRSRHSDDDEPLRSAPEPEADEDDRATRPGRTRTAPVDEEVAPARNRRASEPEPEAETPRRRQAPTLDEAPSRSRSTEAPSRSRQAPADEEDNINYDHPDKGTATPPKPRTRTEPVADENDEVNDPGTGEEAEVDEPQGQTLPPPPGRGATVTDEDDTTEETHDPAPARPLTVADESEDEAPPRVSARGTSRPSATKDENPDLGKAVRASTGRLKR